MFYCTQSMGSSRPHNTVTRKLAASKHLVSTEEQFHDDLIGQIIDLFQLIFSHPNFQGSAQRSCRCQAAQPTKIRGIVSLSGSKALV